MLKSWWDDALYPLPPTSLTPTPNPTLSDTSPSSRQTSKAFPSYGLPTFLSVVLNDYLLIA